ncbi:hypothetical protein Dfri01_39250 [Dyadobacter frigoris]|uniref:DUF5977 domain-containing protein n=1 Tax=Dyadobacter frigoris TaxID=2576211 RepID=UPI0024A13023|nr:DUF5977 domain-containing protein [Dyadobacter frigoris]GLU54464.1 hypothetical protein Dfri01_39250 [Dyadobacter frigoris]
MIDFIKEGLTWLDVDLVRNEVQHIVPALDPEVYPDRTGIKYYLDLDLPEFPMSSNYETLIRLEGREKPPILSAGAYIYQGCSFRLESLLAGQLTITAPLKNNTLLSAVASLTTKYRIREIIEPGLLDNSLPTRTAMRAGLALRDFVGYEHSFFSRYQAVKRQFLTWHPNKKLISPNQREYLDFLLNLADVPQTIKLRVRITRSNGQREVLTKSSISGLRQFQIIRCQVGPQVLELDPDVIKYEVWLSDVNDQRFTETRTFNIDSRKHPFERFLLFSNSFGGFDSMRLLGMATQETDVARNTSRKEREAGKGLDFSELEVISVNENSGIKLSTGFFERDAAVYLDYLRELMLSEVLLLDTDYGFEAVNLITNNLEYSKDRAGLIERSFELERTYSDRNYSRMPAVASIAGRPTKWAGVSPKAVLDSFGKRTGYLSYERLQKIYVDDQTKVVPYAVKPNLPGDPDFIDPMLEASIVPGSTPYPSVLINRTISYKRDNCGTGYLGTAPVINIPAGTYGGEGIGDADELAESKFETFNNQAYANSAGACNINNVPFHFGILHRIPMFGTKVIDSPDYGPVVALRVNGNVAVSNTTGNNPPTNRLSDATFAPGLYTLVISIEYSSNPLRACKIKIAEKGKEVIVNAPGFVIFENVLIDSLDEPLTIEVTNL